MSKHQSYDSRVAGGNANGPCDYHGITKQVGFLFTNNPALVKHSDDEIELICACGKKMCSICVQDEGVLQDCETCGNQVCFECIKECIECGAPVCGNPLCATEHCE